MSGLRWHRSMGVRLLMASLTTTAGATLLWVALVLFAPRLPGLYPTGAERGLLRHLAREVETEPEAERLVRRLTRAAADLDLDLLVTDPAGRPLFAAGQPLGAPSAAQLEAAANEVVALPTVPVTIAAPVGRPARAFVLVGARSLLAPGYPWRAGVAAIGTLVFALAVMLPVLRSITRRLARLSEVAGAWGRGELEKRSELSGSDEIALLAKAVDEMAAQLEVLRRSERELLANASHELKTPLTRLRMALAVIERSSPALEQRLGALELELTELEQLVSRVLTIGRLELGEAGLRLERVALCPLLEKAKERVLSLQPERSIVIDCPPDLELDVEVLLFERALENVLENARRYDHSGRPIRISARIVEEQTSIEIEDHGPGLPAEERARVFTPFFRGAAGRRAEGSGLGLTFARKVARAHGGDVELFDTSGGGATLRLTFQSVSARRGAPGRVFLSRS